MKKTILLVDDCAMMRRFLNTILSDNFNVVSLDNPNKAILWLKTNPEPDAIMLDIDLPEMSGFDTLHQLKNHDTWSEIPVMMLSGIKNAEKRWQCLEAGANDFLAKPFHPKELKLRANLLTQSMKPSVALSN